MGYVPFRSGRLRGFDRWSANAQGVRRERGAEPPACRRLTEVSEHFRAKHTPLRVMKMRQNKKLE
jgi:hypothetical protein